METRVYYFVWDDWNIIFSDDPNQFYDELDNVVEKDSKGCLVARFNKRYIREIGYLPSPEKSVRPDPRYEQFSNTLYNPGTIDDES